MLISSQYFKGLHNCFSNDIIRKYELQQMKYYRCKRCTFTQKRTIDLYHVLGNQNVLCDWCDTSQRSIFNSTTYNTLHKIGFPSNVKDPKTYQKLIFRILLNPTSDIIYDVLAFRRKYFEGKVVIGIQIRCGGSLADSNEVSQMVNNNQLKRIPARIIERLSYYNTDPVTSVLFISTDSTKAFKYIQLHLEKQNYTVLESSMYERGHTTASKLSENHLKRALVDLYLLAESDIILRSHSSFGLLACIISRKRACAQMEW